jgi:putative acetyltransferase
MPLLFSYGTLQHEDVQLSTFGRRLDGHIDALPRFDASSVQIEDPALVATLGKTNHANVTFTGNHDSRVTGMALEITDAELASADAYEAAFAYARVAVLLASGRQAWVYVYARPIANGLTIEQEPLTSVVAESLIAALNAELAARYPEPGATHFRLDPNEVAPGAGAFLVARLSGRPVACGALRSLRDPALIRELGPHVGELKRMYVSADVRGQGIGRDLLARLEAEARALGLTRLVLETGTRQTEALALYRRAGFTDIPAYGEYAASPNTSVCLTKIL